MIKYILVLSMLVCYLPSFATQNEAYELVMENVHYDGHTWIAVRMKGSGEFKLIHHPDCEKCYIDYQEFLQKWEDSIGSVEVQKGSSGKYTVDQSGSVG